MDEKMLHQEKQASEKEDEIKKLRALNLTLLRENERLREVSETCYSFTAKWEWDPHVIRLRHACGIEWVIHPRLGRFPLCDTRWRIRELELELWSADFSIVLLQVRPDGGLNLRFDGHILILKIWPKQVTLPVLSAIGDALDDPPDAIPADFRGLGPAFRELIAETRKMEVFAK